MRPTEPRTAVPAEYPETDPELKYIYYLEYGNHKKERKCYAPAEQEDECPPGRPGGISDQDAFSIGRQGSRVLVKGRSIAARDALINVEE